MYAKKNWTVGEHKIWKYFGIQWISLQYTTQESWLKTN